MDAAAASSAIGEHVAARGELRHHDELRAARDGLLQRDPDALQVAVDLAETDLGRGRGETHDRVTRWGALCDLVMRGRVAADQSSSVAVTITPTGAR